MRVFNIEIRKVLPDDEEIKHTILENVEQNAKEGLIHAQLELRHHSILLEEAPGLGRTEFEIKGYEDAIERDKKAINNFNTQLKAINYERN
jgi:hypothetical protein